MLLDEPCRRSADDGDQIEWALGKEGLKVINERALVLPRRKSRAERQPATTS